MQIIIDIPEEIYQKIKEANRFISGKRSGKRFDYIIYNAIHMGTPISKGHGRIIDESKITQIEYNTYEQKIELGIQGTIAFEHAVITGTDAPTIIGSDKGREKE